MKMKECEDCQCIVTVDDHEKTTPCPRCGGRMGRPTTKQDPVAKFQCSAGLNDLRPDGEPHPLMEPIYKHLRYTKDKESDMLKAIADEANEFERKLWIFDRGN
jgi:predicted RNA-binding Zn-ribbon protein involved in translation (DUF1610 family)